jgi:ribosomal protein S18 acetylase RimI-like enzyme
MRGKTGGPAGGGPDGDASSVRRGELRDAPGAASLHAQLIADGFLSSLGPGFLRRLYRRIIRADGSFLLVAEADSTVIGFVAGSEAVGALYRSFFWRDGVIATLSAPLQLITGLPRVLETLRHGRGAATAEGGELLAIAVDPTWRHRHVGRQLVEGFLHELEQRGARAARVVVGSNNAAAIAMYRQAGFTPTRTFEMHRGTQSVLMEAAVPTGAVPSA